MENIEGTNPTTREDIIAVMDGSRVIGYVVERGFQHFTSHASNGRRFGPPRLTALASVRAVQTAAGLIPVGYTL